MNAPTASRRAGAAPLALGPALALGLALAGCAAPPETATRFAFTALERARWPPRRAPAPAAAGPAT